MSDRKKIEATRRKLDRQRDAHITRMETLRVGQMIVVHSGEYSDWRVDGILVMVADIDREDARTGWENYIKKAGSRPKRFCEWMIWKKYAKWVDHDWVKAEVTWKRNVGKRNTPLVTLDV